VELDRTVRLGPLPEEQWDDRTRAALAALLPPERRNPRGAGNALATLARHPDLAEAFLPFNTRLLLRSTLPPRLRELAILRVARRSGCAYEWAHHIRIAAKTGLSEAEIEAAGDGKVIGPDAEVRLVSLVWSARWVRVRSTRAARTGAGWTRAGWTGLSWRLWTSWPRTATCPIGPGARWPGIWTNGS